MRVVERGRFLSVRGKSFSSFSIAWCFHTARITSVVRCDRRRPDDFRYAPLDGVIGRPSLWIAEDFLGAALQADGETRSVVTASSIRRRSAAWTILPDWTYRSRRRVSAFWMTRARS